MGFGVLGGAVIFLGWICYQFSVIVGAIVLVAGGLVLVWAIGNYYAARTTARENLEARKQVEVRQAVNRGSRR